MATLPDEETEMERLARIAREEEERLREEMARTGDTILPERLRLGGLTGPEEEKRAAVEEIVAEALEEKKEEKKDEKEEEKRLEELIEEIAPPKSLIGKLDPSKLSLKFKRRGPEELLGYKGFDEIAEEEEARKEEKVKTGALLSDMLRSRSVSTAPIPPSSLTTPTKPISSSIPMSGSSAYGSPSSIGSLVTGVSKLGMYPPPSVITSTTPAPPPVSGDPFASGVYPTASTSTAPTAPTSTTPTLGSTPPPSTGYSKLVMPEEKYESAFNDEEDMKKHYEGLDQFSQDFLDAYFKPNERRDVSMYLGNDQLDRLIHNKDFLRHVFEEANEDIKEYNSYLDPANQYELIDLKYVNKGKADPRNLQQIAYMINLYAQKLKNPEALNYMLSYDPVSSNILKKSDIVQLANKSHMQEQDPELLIERYLTNLQYNMPIYDIPTTIDFNKSSEIADEMQKNKEEFLDSKISEEEYNRRNDLLQNIGFKFDKIKNLKDAQEQMVEYKVALENEDIDQKDFENKVTLLHEKIMDDFGKDPILQDTLRHIKVKTFQDINQFNNWLRKLDTLIASRPNNPVTTELKNLITNVIEEIKDGELDIHQAYKKLSTIGPIQQAINLDEKTEALELQSEEKQIDVPILDLDTMKKYYKKARNEHFIGFEGISLKGMSSIIPNEKVYDLRVNEIGNLMDNAKQAIKENRFDTIDLKSKKQLKDVDLKTYSEKLIGDLSNAGFDFDPEVYSIVKDIEENNNDPITLRKDLLIFHNNMAKFLSNLNDLYMTQKTTQDEMDNEIQTKEQELDLEYQTKIDDAKDPLDKPKIEKERDDKKSFERHKIQALYEKHRTTKVKKSLTAMKKHQSQPLVPLTKKVTKMSTKMVKVLKPKPVKVIIPKDLSEEKENVRKYAKALYAHSTNKHEPQFKRSSYGTYVLEFKIQNDEDIKNMLREIKPLKGKLYMVDLPTGRLHEIESDKVITGATYVFQRDIPSQMIGGGLVHGSSAYHPVLSSILKDDQKLFPQVWMQNGNDKIPAFFAKLHKSKNSKEDYTDQMRNVIGGSIWKSIKHGIKGMGQDAKGYFVDNTVNAAKGLAKQTVGEAKNFVQQEKKNINNIGNANKRFYKNPSFGNLNRAINSTVAGSTKLITQPAWTAARELANVSDFAGKVPGLNVAKYGLEYAFPPLAVADSLAHATRDLGVGSNEKAKYLDATINGLDAVLGTGKLSGKIETGTKALNLGMKVADIFDSKNH